MPQYILISNNSGESKMFEMYPDTPDNLIVSISDYYDLRYNRETNEFIENPPILGHPDIYKLYLLTEINL